MNMLAFELPTWARYKFKLQGWKTGACQPALRGDVHTNGGRALQRRIKHRAREHSGPGHRPQPAPLRDTVLPVGELLSSKHFITHHQVDLADTFMIVPLDVSRAPGRSRESLLDDTTTPA